MRRGSQETEGEAAAAPEAFDGGPATVWLSDAEAARARAVAAVLARRAGADPAIRKARRLLLGDPLATLPEEGAVALLASPAVRVLSRGEARRRGIPLLGHQAEALDGAPDPRFPGGAAAGHLRIVWTGGEVVDRFRPCLFGGRLDLAGEDLAWVDVPAEAGEAGAVRARRGSVLAELGGWDRELARRYPWPSDRALWFLLTGTPPTVSPLDVRVSPAHDETPPRIAVAAEPWVSTETVCRAYREVQHQLLGGRSRPAGDRLVALFAFVGGLREAERPPSWRALLEDWNRTHPEWAYADVRNFAADAKRASTLLLPPYRPAEPPAERPADAGDDEA